MLTPTIIERLPEMPDCPFTTDDCFCSEHFASKKPIIKRTIGAIATVTTKDKAVDTKVETCPKGRIMLLGNTAYSVKSIFTTEDR